MKFKFEVITKLRKVFYGKNVRFKNFFRSSIRLVIPVRMETRPAQPQSADEYLQLSIAQLYWTAFTAVFPAIVGDSATIFAVVYEPFVIILYLSLNSVLQLKKQ